MPRGLKTKLKIGRTKIVKGIPPALGISGMKPMPKSRAMPFEQNSLTKIIPTLKKQGKPKLPM